MLLSAENREFNFLVIIQSPFHIKIVYSSLYDISASDVKNLRLSDKKIGFFADCVSQKDII